MKHKKSLRQYRTAAVLSGSIPCIYSTGDPFAVYEPEGSDGYGLSNYQVLLQEKRTREAIFNTILIAASSTLIAIVAGSGLALAAAYTNIKRKKTFRITGVASFHYPVLYYHPFLERFFK